MWEHKQDLLANKIKRLVTDVNVAVLARLVWKLVLAAILSLARWESFWPIFFSLVWPWYLEVLGLLAVAGLVLAVAAARGLNQHGKPVIAQPRAAIPLGVLLALGLAETVVMFLILN